jgi:CheY-like chemotaxis protein/anti-sigma regulatory factor (Ser/Thr protein kinase)
MKLILAESNKKELEKLRLPLNSWGFQPIERETDSSILSTLKNDPEARFVLIGNSNFDLELLIDRIRSLPNYICIVYAIEDDKELESISHLNRIDKIVRKPYDLRLLRLLLFGFRQVLVLLTDLSGYRRDSTLFSSRQVLNLETLLQNQISDLPTLKGILLHFIEELNGIIADGISLEEPVLERFLEQSEKLGCEQLSDWLMGLLFVKSNAGVSELLSDSFFLYQFSGIRQSLVLGIGCLEEFGYFTGNMVQSNSNLLEGKRILLVEDMKHNRILLRKILEKNKCIIEEAENGEDAVQQWKQHTGFDIIIMDMNMPVMDGFAATREIRKIESEKSLLRTPIVALTALAMRGDKELCLEAGTDDYLPKPVDSKTLISICRRLLSQGETPDIRNRELIPDLQIKSVLLKSKNQVTVYALGAIFSGLSIDLDVHEETNDVLTQIAEKEFDLVVLDSEMDLELAYFIKTNFGLQNIALIFHQNQTQELLAGRNLEILICPFKTEQVISVLVHFSDKVQQALQDAEKLADADSLDKIKSRVSIEEAVLKSNNQLAVWQKAFRKIGGDLVLSHQFNLHGKFGFILGDVAGHDIQSGYTASWFSGLVDGTWGQNSDPYKLLVNLNNLFAHDTEEENKRFVCALVLLWDPIREVLYYANAGIPGGIVIKKDTGKADSMDWTGVPIGMFPEMDMYDHGIMDFKKGDRLIIATDGVLEAIPRDVISELSESKSGRSAQYTLDAIVDFVTRSIEITDDLTIAVFEADIPDKPEAGFRQTIKSDFREVDFVVEEMSKVLQEVRPDSFDWGMISVAIREALINAVEHGNKNHVELPVDVDFELKGNLLIVTVSDCGSGFDLATEKKRLALEGDLRIHGRGIEMMENIGASIYYQGGGIRLEFNENESA